MAGECLIYVRAARSGVAFQQGCCRNDEATGAVAALSGTFRDKGVLYGARLTAVRQSFDCYDVFSNELRNGPSAGQNRFVVDKYGTSAALLQAASKFCPG